MLAGVGGRTIAEAKNSIPWDEFQGWLKYRAKHGPLDSAKRIEDAAAQIAFTVSCTIPRAKGSPLPKLEDFRMYAIKEPPKPIGLEEAMATWK